MNFLLDSFKNKLTLALVIYGSVGSSTPDEFGLAEAVIGFLLVWYCFERLHPAYILKSFTCYVLFFLMLYPLFVAFAFGNSPSDVIRDVIPFLFMFFSFSFFYNKKILSEERFVVFGLCVAGTLFATRHFLSIINEIGDVGTRSVFSGMDYYIMDPAVLFASMLSFAGMFISNGMSFGRLAFAFSFSITAFGMVSMLLRGQLALAVINSLSELFQKSARCILLLAVFFVISMVYFWPVMVEYVDVLSAKTNSTGFLNSRDAEFLDVYLLISKTPSLLITGLGWGGVFDTVASGGEVRYTHNSFLYFLLKGGVLCLLCYIFLIYRILFGFKVQYLLTATVLRVAYLVVVFNMFLEPGYKMLSMGVLLYILNINLKKKYIIGGSLV